MRRMILLALGGVLGSGSTQAANEDPLAPIAASDWTLAAARHLLDRAGFGGSPEEIARVHALGAEGAVDALLAASRVGFERYDAKPLRGRYRQERRSMGGQLTPEMDKDLRRTLLQDEVRQFEGYRGLWFERMVTTQEPLREKMALFWHGWFTSAQRDVRDSSLVIDQVEMYRELGLTSFRELLHKASKQPAMLEYLDNDANRKQAPNENFAREVMELFTLGPGHYTERDIKEAARAFTGWQDREGDFYFNSRVHDAGMKDFLGQKGAFKGEDILDILLEQDQTARFVAGRLFAFFAYPDPPPEIVDPLAKILRQSNYRLHPLLRAIFLSKAFHSTSAQGAQFKSPVEFTVSTVRRLEIRPPSYEFLASVCGALGQELLNPPNVKGWEGGEAWISASTLVLRANLARVFVFGVPALRGQFRGGRTDGLSLDGRAMRLLKNYHSDLDVSRFIGDARTSTAAVAAICDRLLPVAPSRSTVAELARYAAPFGDDAFDPSDPGTRRALMDVVHMVLCLPEYQLN